MENHPWGQGTPVSRRARTTAAASHLSLPPRWWLPFGRTALWAAAAALGALLAGAVLLGVSGLWIFIGWMYVGD
ncbi:hypothetical protein OG500_20545 [Kitasatospora sp. NBC_01250]|uniref:hypothetical protein n=1 Tax=unclassified Kitasatospora TaxID=2633591 RepID=UPI002E0D46F7|nr:MULTISPECIES: hypothetical protein [unclassified Kitasatospora]WSJ68454.1 hypothetical protein OG294_21350 [Kitasatospora sp. NBC_01302]